MFPWLRQQLRRTLTAFPSGRTPEDHNAWLAEQVKAYATPQPYAAPLTGGDNYTGETWEIREGYRRFAFKEPSVKAALLSKMLAVAQLNLVVKPYNNSTAKQDRDIAKWVKWAIGNSLGGVAAIVYKVGTHALIDGFSVTEKVQDIVPDTAPDYAGHWTLGLTKSKDVKGVRFRLDLFKNVVGVRSMIAAQGGQEFSPSDFLIFTHLPLFESPWGISDLRAANRAANLIEAAIKLRAILLENFSGPYMIGKSDDAGTRERIKQVLKDARARGWIVVPDNASVEVINLATSAPDQFQNTIEDLRQEIVTAIQGAYLQLLEGGVADGRGNTEVHKGVSQLYQWWLASCIGTVLNESLVPDLVYPNYGYGVGLPTVSLGGIDAKSIVEELNRFTKGHELNLALSKRQVREVGDFETPDDEDDTLLPPSQQPPPEQSGGFGGAGGPGGGFPDLSAMLGGGNEPPGTEPPPDRDGAIQPESKGGNGETPVVEFHDTTDGTGYILVGSRLARAFSEGEYGVMSLADRSHLVKKVVRDTKGVTRTVYVNPHKGDHGTEEERMRPRREAALALNHALTNPGKLSPDHLRALPEHLKALTKAQKKDILRSLSLHVSDSKQHLVDRLLAYAKKEPQPKRPEGPDTLYKVVRRFGGIDPKSFAFLGQYSNVKEAMQNGISLGVFKKGGGGLDALAKELHGSGYITKPDPETLLEELRKGSKAAHNSTLKDWDKELESHWQMEKEAAEYAKSNPESKPALAEAKAKAHEAVASVPTTKKARRELAKSIGREWKEIRNEIAKTHGTREINDLLTDKEIAAESRLLEAVEVLSSGRERDGTLDLGQVSDERYRGWLRGARQALDVLRAGTQTIPFADRTPKGDDPPEQARLRAPDPVEELQAQAAHLELLARELSEGERAADLFDVLSEAYRVAPADVKAGAIQPEPGK